MRNKSSRQWWIGYGVFLAVAVVALLLKPTSTPPTEVTSELVPSIPPKPKDTWKPEYRTMLSLFGVKLGMSKDEVLKVVNDCPLRNSNDAKEMTFTCHVLSFDDPLRFEFYKTIVFAENKVSSVSRLVYYRHRISVEAQQAVFAKYPESTCPSPYKSYRFWGPLSFRDGEWACHNPSATVKIANDGYFLISEELNDADARDREVKRLEALTDQRRRTLDLEQKTAVERGR
ncbi:MAG: hypothetical protein ACRYGP_23060 [Janthinobacterium lividum]